ncbi:hypothetical protein ACLMJK_001795 [Lecanora helva]
MGARLFRPYNPGSTDNQSSKVGFVIHAGSDLSESMMTELKSWNTGSNFIQTPDRLTTRGRNVYQGELREFAFLNPKIQVVPSMLDPAMLTSKTFHLICTPARCIDLVKCMRSKRAEVLRDSPQLQAKTIEPIFVWEPMEGSCRPQELPSFYEALHFVNVFSPNEHELDLLFNGPDGNGEKSMSIEKLHNHCIELLHKGLENMPGVIVVRRGPFGCVVVAKDRLFNLPAYYTPPTTASPEELVSWHDSKNNWDVTGGGNAFLGGYCIGFLNLSSERPDGDSSSKFETAALYGSVAASFAIEQVGMPVLSSRSADGKELWNGEGEWS